MGDDRLIFRPVGAVPGVPLVAGLIENADRSIEEFGESNAPTGAAFDGFVRLNPAHREHLISLVDHMKDGLEYLSDRFCIGISASHFGGDDFHAYIASRELDLGQYLDIFFAGELVTLEGERGFGNTEFLGTFAERLFRAFEPAAVKVKFIIRHSYILSRVFPVLPLQTCQSVN